MQGRPDAQDEGQEAREDERRGAAARRLRDVAHETGSGAPVDRRRSWLTWLTKFERFDPQSLGWKLATFDDLYTRLPSFRFSRRSPA